jgi:hypothetical protein
LARWQREPAFHAETDMGYLHLVSLWTVSLVGLAQTVVSALVVLGAHCLVRMLATSILKRQGQIVVQ